MDKLPDLDKRWIPDSKIRDFALGGTTPKAKERHAFFASYGFTRSNWMELKAAAIAHAEAHDAEIARKDEYGTTYVITGEITTPDGRNPIVTAYWIVCTDDPRPQLTSIFRRT